MKKYNKVTIYKIASVYIGTVIGAGFASGQELLQFFTSYGKDGMYGIILAGVLFAFIGWAVLDTIFSFSIKSYKEFINGLMGNLLGTTMEIIVSLFMLACFCAMLAGSGALLNQKFGLEYQIGVLIMAVACFITFLFDIKGVIAINALLVPLLIIGTFILGFNIIIFQKVEAFNSMLGELFHIISSNWVASSLLYVSYNSITSVVVLTSLNNLLDSKKTAKWGGIVGGLTLGVIGLCLGIATLVKYDKIIGMEIPMLAIVMEYKSIIEYVYIVMLICAMFTTAIANGYGFISRVSSVVHINFKVLNPVTIVLSIVIAQMGFSYMVSKVYPVFGYLGMFQIILIMTFFIKTKLNNKS